MKKIAFLLFFLLPGLARSEIVKTIGNQWTGSPDYITVLSSGTIPPGSTNYVQNTSVLQVGASFYVLSGTLSGPLTVNGLTALKGPLSFIPPGWNPYSILFQDSVGNVSQSAALLWFKDTLQVGRDDAAGYEMTYTTSTGILKGVQQIGVGAVTAVPRWSINGSGIASFNHVDVGSITISGDFRDEVSSSALILNHTVDETTATIGMSFRMTGKDYGQFYANPANNFPGTEATIFRLRGYAFGTFGDMLSVDGTNLTVTLGPSFSLSLPSTLSLTARNANDVLFTNASKSVSTNDSFKFTTTTGLTISTINVSSQLNVPYISSTQLLYMGPSNKVTGDSGLTYNGTALTVPGIHHTGAGTGVVTSNASDYVVIASTGPNLYPKFTDNTGVIIATDGPKSPNYFQQTGTARFERWYTTNMNNAAFATLIAVKNTLYCAPFVNQRGGTVDHMAFNVSAASAPFTGKVCLYNAVADTDLYPNRLVKEADDMTTGIIGNMISTTTVVLTPNQAYFACFISSGQPTVRASFQQNVPSYFGTDASLSAQPGNMISVASTYTGTCPDPYPAGGVITSGVPPNVYLRYSQ